MPKRIESRYWMFTWNNYDGVPDEVDMGPHFRGLVFQEELGEKGTPHLQGYVEFTRGVSPTAVRKMLPCHWEVRKGTREQAIAYCTKQESRQAGPYWLGRDLANLPVRQGQRTDWEKATAAFKSGMSKKEFVENFPQLFVCHPAGVDKAMMLYQPERDSPVNVVYVYGKPGLGKSRYIRSKFPGAYWKSAGKWWDGYERQEVVVFDDFSGSWFSYTDLLKITDRYPYLAEVKHGHGQLLCTTIVISSNTHADKLYSGEKIDPVAFLRRINQYVVFFKKNSYCNYGKALSYFKRADPDDDPDAPDEPTEFSAETAAMYITDVNEDYSNSTIKPPSEY